MNERQRELHERLAMPEALLSRTDVAKLGLTRRGVDAVFRAFSSCLARCVANPRAGSKAAHQSKPAL